MFPLPSAIPTQGALCAPSASGACAAPPNEATLCLQQEVALWASIAFDPFFPKLRLPARYRLNAASPFDVMPVDALALSYANSLPLADITTSNRYYQVLSYLVPAGYDGVINNRLNKFVPQNGPTFQDGSGQLTWAIGINNYLLLNYSNITITMGDSPHFGPTQHGGGIRLKANDTVTYYVSATDAGRALDPAGIIVCGFQGWLYPNR